MADYKREESELPPVRRPAFAEAVCSKDEELVLQIPASVLSHLIGAWERVSIAQAQAGVEATKELTAALRYMTDRAESMVEKSTRKG
jgi:hypothetical protein